MREFKSLPLTCCSPLDFAVGFFLIFQFPFPPVIYCILLFKVAGMLLIPWILLFLQQAGEMQTQMRNPISVDQRDRLTTTVIVHKRKRTHVWLGSQHYGTDIQMFQQQKRRRNTCVWSLGFCVIENQHSLMEFHRCYGGIKCMWSKWRNI